MIYKVIYSKTEFFRGIISFFFIKFQIKTMYYKNIHCFYFLFRTKEKLYKSGGI